MVEEYSENTKKLFPKELNSRHRSAMRMEIAGHTNQDIAKELGFNEQRLSVIQHSPLYVEEKEKMEGDVKREFVQAEGKKLAMDTTAQLLADSTEKAAKTLDGALDQGGSVAVSAAKDILDRGGYAKEEKVRASVLVEPSQSLLDMLTRNKGSKDGDDKPESTGGHEAPPVGKI